MNVPPQFDDVIDVQDLRLEQPIQIPGDLPLHEAIALMNSHRLHSCLVIVEGGTLLGILTERDIVRLSLLDQTVQQSRVRDVMTSPVITLEEKDFSDIFSAYSLMRRHRIRHLPVVDEQQQVLGIVTLSLLRQALHLGYFLRFREVREIMAANVITAPQSTSVLQIAQMMAQHRISCVVIIEARDHLTKPLGVVTERDIVQLQGQGTPLASLTAANIMSAPLITLKPEDSLAIAQEKMQRHQIRRIIVVGKQGELQGILTETNISQVLDPLELFGMLEILQRRVKQLIQDRDRLLPQENRYLQEALNNEEFVLYYQPQIHSQTQTVIGAEVLVRWLCPKRGLVPPNEFIPLAEMTGFIIPLGEWILRRACIQTQQWQAQTQQPLKISVNIASSQLQHPYFVSRLEKILAETGLPPSSLVLELTESSLVENIELTIAQFQALKKIGVAIAIDDFGTGYASLGYLQHFPFDILKIDRCFVDNIHNNPKNAAITTAIIRMATQLDFAVVAEGIEKVEEMEFLNQLQCDYFQGYLISRPLPEEAFFQFCRQSLVPAAVSPKPN